MKKFMIDKSIYVALGIICAILAQYYYIGFLRILWASIALVSCFYLGQEALLYPIDLVLGKNERIVYFSHPVGYRDAEFFKDTNSLEWVFYYSENRKTKKLILNLNF